MEVIRDLFAKEIDRRIEEVIKVDQTDEATVHNELQEYVITESIADHFITVFRAIADAPAEPHEGIGIWVSGFFGSGKSSFAKIVGYTVANRTVCSVCASDIVKEKVKYDLSPSTADSFIAYLDLINAKIPTHAIIFDVSTDRGVRYANERITEIMYKALLRELGYAEDFDLAELEITLEADGLLDEFCKEFEKLHGKPWEIRRKIGMAINEASAVMHRLRPDVYNAPDSWAKSIGEGRADITPNLLAKRAFELTSRRKPGYALIFIIDEVGQYVSRSVDKMFDLQGVVQAFGREGKNRVIRNQAVAPCWIVVTSQEKLNEVVDALDSRKIELARLQDRFPYTIDLKQSDISEITSKRILKKNSHGYQLLADLYQKHEGRIKALCTLERTSRNTGITKQTFIDLYPYLPYQIDLCIDIVSGLRLRRGAQRHIGGSNRTIIKQAQQMLIHPRTNLAERPVGELVTLDQVYELLYAGTLLPTEVTREVDDVPARLPNNPLAHKVAKAIALLEVVRDLPRTPHNLAVVLHPRVDADSLLPEVEAALKDLVEAQVVRDSEDGYKLLTVQEKNWDSTRRELGPKPAHRNQIKKEILKEIFAEPSIRGYRYQNRKVFPMSLTIDGEVIETSGHIPLQILVADDAEDFNSLCDEARRISNEKRDEIQWVFIINEELHRLIEELYRSRTMINMHEHLAAQGKLSPEEISCLTEEKIRRDRFQRKLKKGFTEAVASGVGFFRGVRKDGSALGKSIGDVFSKLRDEVIPELYPKFELGNRPIKGDEAEKFLAAANLQGLPQVFYEPPEGLNLVIRQSGKAIPNLNAEICREVLEYLKREHSYGNKITGKLLELHFGGLGYAWDRDILRLVLAVLLRGGAIEVTYQGRKYRSHSDPACRQPFNKQNAFRVASFAPRIAIDLKMLTEAARQYENITGEEVDIEEGALAEAFKRLAADDKEILLPLIAKVKTSRLPGIQYLEEFRDTLEGILEMPTDDCVKTLAGEGKSYQEARLRMQRLNEVLTNETLDMLGKARRVLETKYPILKSRCPTDEIKTGGERLKELLEDETFYEHLDDIHQALKLLSEKYFDLYNEYHKKRFDVYSKALDRIKGRPEWVIVSSSPDFDEARLNSLTAQIADKMCETAELSIDSECCKHCSATIAQMESDIAAVDSFVADVIRELQKLATPEKKIVRFRVSSVARDVIETPEEVEEVIEQLRKQLLKLLVEDVCIVLE